MRTGFTAALGVAAALFACGCVRDAIVTRSGPPPYAPALAGVRYFGTSAAGEPLFRREADGAEMMLVPAGPYDSTFEDGSPGPRYYLPSYYLDRRPVTGVNSEDKDVYARRVGAVRADRHHLDKAAKLGMLASDDPPGTFRCVIEAPIRTLYPVEWRGDIWAAVDEARRRNCIVFITMHWDGCGACDRFRSSILTVPEVCEYLNENVVPVLAYANQDFCEPHHPMPDGRCWIFPPLTCAQHVDCFYRGPAALLDFPGSPGHYVLDPRMSNVPLKEKIVLCDDRDLPGEGTPEFWLRTWREAQEKLGPAIPQSEYTAREKEFRAFSEAFAADPASADKDHLAAIAGAPRGPFREEALLLLNELSSGKPLSDPSDGSNLAASAQRISELLEVEEAGEALAELRALKAAPTVNPLALWVRDMERWVERLGFQRLVVARARAGYYNDPEGAKELYAEIEREFEGTEVGEAAKAEREALER